MAAYFGQIEQYDGSSDLEAYLERLELYFVANNVGTELSFKEITDTLKSHLKPRRLTVAERYKFHQRTQKDGEAVTAC